MNICIWILPMPLSIYFLFNVLKLNLGITKPQNILIIFAQFAQSNLRSAVQWITVHYVTVLIYTWSIIMGADPQKGRQKGPGMGWKLFLTWTVINWPGVAGAVLQSALSFIH